MKQLLSTFLILFSFCSGEYAQHCRFDNMDIIVLSIHSKKNNSIIPHLNICFLDNLGNVLTKSSTYLTNSFFYTSYSDTLKFSQNNSNRKSFPELGVAQFELNKFKFVQKNYMFISFEDFPIQSLQIKIEDVDGELNGGHFETKIITLTKEALWDLCSNSAVYYMDKNPPNNRKRFVPYEVVLETQK